jgi:hypothetical protein
MKKIGQKAMNAMEEKKFWAEMRGHIFRRLPGTTFSGPAAIPRDAHSKCPQQ